MTMTRDEFAKLLDVIQEEERRVREDGQREYTTGRERGPFSNFDTVGDIVPCPHCGKPVGRYVALMVYALKHVFGILSWVGGHKSQREDVRGRIKDARMYLALLRGMVEEGARDAAEGIEHLDEPEEYVPEPECGATWTYFGTADEPAERQCSMIAGHPGPHRFDRVVTAPPFRARVGLYWDQDLTVYPTASSRHASVDMIPNRHPTAPAIVCAALVSVHSDDAVSGRNRRLATYCVLPAGHKGPCAAR